PVETEPLHLVAQRASRNVEPLHDRADAAAALREAPLEQRALEGVDLLLEGRRPACLAMRLQVRAIGRRLLCLVGFAQHESWGQRKRLQNYIESLPVLMRKGETDIQQLTAGILPRQTRIDAERRSVALAHWMLPCPGASARGRLLDCCLTHGGASFL